MRVGLVAATSSRHVTRRPRIATWAPSAASWRAMAAPIPEDAPTTIAFSMQTFDLDGCSVVMAFSFRLTCFLGHWKVVGVGQRHQLASRQSRAGHAASLPFAQERRQDSPPLPAHSARVGLKAERTAYGIGARSFEILRSPHFDDADSTGLAETWKPGSAKGWDGLVSSRSRLQ